jgi:hypothetical protein
MFRRKKELNDITRAVGELPIKRITGRGPRKT